jgi:hypothetical protein
LISHALEVPVHVAVEVQTVASGVPEKVR